MIKHSAYALAPVSATRKRSKVLAKLLVLVGCQILAATSNAQLLTDDEDQLMSMYGDDQMISIATGIEQPIHKAPAVASVVTADQIHAMGASDLDQVLETIPGLHVSRASIGYNPVYTFRGIHSSYNPQVLVLINGIPITNLFHGDRGQSWGGMPVESIERIEVIRGPGSAVYGAEAFAGTINIITKTADDVSGTALKAASGSYNTTDLSAIHSNEWLGLKFLLAGEYHKTDGHDGVVESDAQTRFDSIIGTEASLAPGNITLSRENLDLRVDIQKDKWRIRSGLQRRRDWGAGVGVAEALDPHNRYNSDRFNADVTWTDQIANDAWDLSVQASYLSTTHEIDKDLIIFPPGFDMGFGAYDKGLIGNPEVLETHSRFNITASSNTFDSHSLRLGAGYYYGDLYEVRETKNFGIDPATDQLLPPNSGLVDVSDTPYVFLREGDRKNAYLFVQDIWQLASDWELTAGLRYDNYSDFGSTVNPRLVLVWSTTQKLTTKVLYGEAFRAPSFAETQAINNPVVLGNPDLDPERLQNYEMNFYYQATEDLTFSINLFNYVWRDIIRFVPDTDASSSTAQNTGERLGQGWESELVWHALDKVSIAANYTWVDTEDKDANNSKVAFAPHQQAYANINWQIISKLNTYIQANRVMGRERQSGDTRTMPEDYTLVDMVLQWNATKDLAFKLVANNIFDQDATEPTPWSEPANLPNDLPLPGSNYRLELHLSF
ncbi:iron complex outermembrane recepter protein [Alteromonadaceae bacterium Bs31]|nr:iron complex outermembrane recepter protein [Alteromonadaceae bacterium Bs31]